MLIQLFFKLPGLLVRDIIGKIYKILQFKLFIKWHLAKFRFSPLDFQQYSAEFSLSKNLVLCRVSDFWSAAALSDNCAQNVRLVHCSCLLICPRQPLMVRHLYLKLFVHIVHTFFQNLFVLKKKQPINALVSECCFRHASDSHTFTLNCSALF